MMIMISLQALCLYDYMKDYAGSSLFVLFKAIKFQVTVFPDSPKMIINILILKFTFATFPFGEISIFRLSWLLCKSIYNSTNWKLSDPRLTPLYQICRLANQRVGVFSMEGNIVLGEYIDHGREEI